MPNPTPEERDRETARKSVVEACNAARNSDLRADHPYVLHAFASALSAARREGEAEADLKTAILRGALAFCTKSISPKLVLSIAAMADERAFTGTGEKLKYLASALEQATTALSSTTAGAGLLKGLEDAEAKQCDGSVHEAHKQMVQDSMRALWGDDPGQIYTAGGSGPGEVIAYFRSQRDAAIKRLEDAERKARAFDWLEAHVGEHGFGAHEGKYFMYSNLKDFEGDSLLEVVEAAAKEPK